MALVHGTNDDEWIDGSDGVTNGADTIYGYDGYDTILGLGGDDTIDGGDDPDWLAGGNGQDLLKGGGGADHLDGDSGIDTASYIASPAGVRVSLDAHAGYGGDAEGDSLVDIENVVGSQYNDMLLGDDNANTLSGLDGSDWIKGYGGADTLYGGSHDDLLDGMSGNDTLRGENGNDSMYGGAGVDTLYGGGGADKFRWSGTAETGLTPATADVVMDFSRVQGDLIELGNVDADVYAYGNQAFSFIGTGAFTGTPGEIRYYHADGDTYIQMQTGTSADVEGVIRLVGIHTPDSSWFVL